MKRVRIPATKAGCIASIVFHAIWFVIALTLFFGGMAFYLYARGDDPVGSWFGWGAFCILPILIPVLKYVFMATGVGAALGLTKFTIEEGYSSYRIVNHPFLYGLIYFLVAGALAVAAGPVVLPIFVIWYGYETVMVCIQLSRI